MDAEEVERNWQIRRAFHSLRGIQAMPHCSFTSKGAREDEVVAFLEENALVTHERAEKMVEFVSHPLWRAYVFCYAGGEELTTRWVEQAGSRKGEIERFSRLLSEQLTPSGIAQETASKS